MKRRRRVKKKNVFLGFILIIFIVASVAVAGVLFLNHKDGGTSNKTNNKEKGEEKEPVIPEVQIVDVNSKSRPYAVMINNLGAARPYHTGLQKAYLVYEIVVEGGITRYLALFKDNLPEEVGSVRSARHYYLDYVMENDAFYVHWGWSPQAQTDISKLGINNINGLSVGSPYFYRKKLNVSSEHTGFANVKAMENYVSSKKWRTETNKGLLLNYSALNVDLSKYEPTEATKLDFKYSSGFTTNYVYDSEINAYKQYVNNKEHTDYQTKEQYTVKNILVYKVSNSTISGDDKGRQDLNNTGSGTGYYITGGKCVEITWSKKDRSSQTIYKYKDGTEITVNDGNTWIHIIPSNGSISVS